MREVVWAKIYVRKPPNTTSNTVTASNATAITSKVEKPRCTKTLSITTWKNNGVTSANNCSTTDTASTSKKIRRYLTTAGINQVKSNFASDPSTEAREASKISRPEKRASNCSRAHTSGRPRSASCTRKRSPSTLANTKCRPSSHQTKAGRASRCKRSVLWETNLAFRPNPFAANSHCSRDKSSLLPSANRCRISAGLAAMP